MDEIKSLIGTVIADRYLIEGVIGVGGMAFVLRARHVQLGSTVAIKILKPPLTESSELSARFAREARAVAGFDHPNCRKVFDTGLTETGLPYMAMQFLEGRELAAVVGRKLPATQCVNLMLQILRGLEHTHAHGVVHRDLKPDNIFVTRDHEGREVLKIVDFGIAKLVDDKADGLTTKVGAIVGTPAYMSPEQALGGDVDARADLYSVGIMGYELLTGRPPFFDLDPDTLMQAHVRSTADPLPPHVPAVLAGTLFTLMAKDRDRRYPSASAAIAVLREVEAQLSTDAERWIPLLGPEALPMMETPHPGDAERRHLAAVDGALRNVLAQHTPAAAASLQTGIRGRPDSVLRLDSDALVLMPLDERLVSPTE